MESSVRQEASHENAFRPPQHRRALIRFRGPVSLLWHSPRPHHHPNARARLDIVVPDLRTNNLARGFQLEIIITLIDQRAKNLDMLKRGFDQVFHPL